MDLDAVELDRVVTRLRAAGCVFAEDEARLLIEAGGDLDDLVARRVAGEPLEPLLGWAEFDGLRILVDPGLFVPRQRSVRIVDEAQTLLQTGGPTAGGLLVDLCCGTGAIGVAVAVRVPKISLVLADLDPAAVACARRNLAAHGIDGMARAGDLFDALPARLRGRVDVLTVNAPYVPTEAIGDMPPEARDHEPRLALDGGPDGLDVLRRVIAGAPSWLAPTGSMIFEAGTAQIGAAEQAIAAARLTPRVLRYDDLDTCVVVGSIS